MPQSLYPPYPIAYSSGFLSALYNGACARL